MSTTKEKTIQHTPGPWRSDGRDIFAGKAYVADTKANAIVSPDEALANARLIAAAPILLDACKTVIARWESDVIPPAEKLAHCVKMIRSAIAKATL